MDIFPKTCFSIFGFLPLDKRNTKTLPGREVTDGSVLMVPMVVQVGFPIVFCWKGPFLQDPKNIPDLFFLSETFFRDRREAFQEGPERRSEPFLGGSEPFLLKR